MNKKTKKKNDINEGEPLAVILGWWILCYLKSHFLPGHCLLQFVVHECVVDAQPTKNSEGLSGGRRGEELEVKNINSLHFFTTS